MKKYRVDKTIRVCSGAIYLDDIQAEKRKHALKKVGDKKYEPISEVCFIHGQVIGLDLTDRVLLKSLTCLDTEEPVVEVPTPKEEIVVAPVKKQKRGRPDK